tara:strand:+ start:4199 stop:4858 length:660 start_codon:yes stop_codon:yes gene_type:complete
MEETENTDKDQEPIRETTDSPAVELVDAEGKVEEDFPEEDDSVYPDEEDRLEKSTFFENLEAPPPRPRRPRRPRRPSIFERRRRVRLQARRVRRVIRHIEVWSVLKVSILFYACLWAVFLIAGFMIWGVAESSGTVGKLETLITELFALDTFTFDGRQIFRGYALGGLVLAIAGSTLNVLMCLLFNLISDLTGGIRITMVEEETVRPTPPRRRRRRTVQ